MPIFFILILLYFLLEMKSIFSLRNSHRKYILYFTYVFLTRKSHVPKPGDAIEKTDDDIVSDLGGPRISDSKGSLILPIRDLLLLLENLWPILPLLYTVI